jgi:hypothetical protein
MQQLGTWFVEYNSPWEEKLAYVSDYEIEKTGMNRQELHKLLKQLDDMNIIR